MERFGCSLVRVRASKPEPPIPLAVEEVAVEVVARAGRLGARRGGRARGSSVRVGYLGLGSNVGDRLGHLRAAVGGSPSTGSASRRPRRSMRPSRSARSSTSPTSSTRPCGSPPSSTRSRCSRSARRSRSSTDACSAVPGTARGRSTSTCCCSGRSSCESERLTLPHPQVTARRFVLVPLLELDPELALPDGTKLGEALEGLGGGSGWSGSGRSAPERRVRVEHLEGSSFDPWADATRPAPPVLARPRTLAELRPRPSPRAAARATPAAGSAGRRRGSRVRPASRARLRGGRRSPRGGPGASSAGGRWCRSAGRRR